MRTVSNPRPFYSVVIPIYNAGKYINNCLMSLVNQHLSKDIMEVIICDDCSPEPCWEQIEAFKDRLNIKTTQTSYNFAPGNTREKAMELVTGEWVTFLDQDDAMIENSLGPTRDKIIQSKEKYYVIGNFVEVDQKTGTVIRNYERITGWNHGKFYNMDNLWKPFNIHFKKDMFSHEDVFITSNVSCCMRRIRRQPFYTDILCYSWVQNVESLTHLKYTKIGNDHGFLEALFDDYLESTGWVYMNRYLEGFIDKEYAQRAIIGCLGYVYAYTESFMFQNPTGYIKENIDLVRDYYIKIKEVFQMTNQDVYDFFAKDNCDVYIQSQRSADVGAGAYIYVHTLKEYLDMLHKDIVQYDPQSKKKYVQ